MKAGRRIALATLALTALAVYAEDAIVTWRAPYFPPFFNGPVAQSEGIFDRIHRQVVAELPQYQHRFGQSNYGRLLNDMRIGQRVCSPALIKTVERDSYVAYSQPVMPLLPPVLIVPAQANAGLDALADEQGRLSLAALLRQTDATLGYLAGRTYGADVDAIVAAAERHPVTNQQLHASRIDTRSLFQMLSADRLTAVLGYPSELAFFEQIDEASQQYRYYELTEQADYLPFHYGCVETQWGREVIRDIDGLLAQPGFRRQLIDIYQSSLPPQGQQRLQQLLVEIGLE